MIVMMITPLIRHKAIAAAAETKPNRLRLQQKEGACRKRTLESLRMVMTLHCYTTNSFVKNCGDGDAEALLPLTPFIPPVVSFISVMSL
jgi:hypothetical protein